MKEEDDEHEEEDAEEVEEESSKSMGVSNEEQRAATRGFSFPRGSACLIYAERAVGQRLGHVEADSGSHTRETWY